MDVTHWKSMTDRDWMFAFDLQGKEFTLTIDRIEPGNVVGTGGKKTKKPVAFFKESKSGKPLALCATNCKTIEKLYGADIEGWAGKRVTLYPTTTNFGGEVVECIRIRPRLPDAKQGKPEQPPEPGSDG